MTQEDALLLIACAAAIAVVWASTLPVSDPFAGHDWEAEASEYASRIRPGDHWGR